MYMKARIFMRKLFFFSCITLQAIIVSLALSGCAGSSTKDTSYPFRISESWDAEEIPLSDTAIDGYPAHEVFILPTEENSCIRVTVTATEYVGLMRTSRLRKTWFILEKPVDVAHLSNSQQQIYTPLARNYTHNWERERSVTWCEKELSSLQSISPDRVLRVRFTIFAKGTINYTITVESTVKSSLSRKKPPLQPKE